MKSSCLLLAIAALGCGAPAIPAWAAASTARYLNQPQEWFRSPEGQRVTTNVLSWQSPHGSWPKNQDNTSAPFTGDPATIQGTFDNRATIDEIRFLAKAYRATSDPHCLAAVNKAIDLLIRAQYPTGGWPQSYPPPPRSYHRHITFNDGAMVRILELLRELSSNSEYAFLEQSRRAAGGQAFDRGIDCIVKSQIRVKGTLTVWCAQHDEVTLEPRPARTYELVSLSGAESAGVLRLLMSLDPPSPEVARAIRAGASWFEKAKITGYRLSREGGERRLVSDPNASPLWARFYEIPSGRPLFSDRDGVPRYDLNDLGPERRNGYSWYGSWGEAVAKDYAAWSSKWAKPGTQ